MQLEFMSLQIRSSRSRGLSASRIITRILSLAETPKLQSQLLEEILISRATLSRYIAFLREQGLLDQVEIDGKIKLKTNAKGKRYLKTKTMLPKDENPSGRNESNNGENGGVNGYDSEDNNMNSNGATYSRPNWNLTPNID
jgi:predicted transcriptional regulator